MSKQIDRILAQGVLAGLLAPVDEEPEFASRPWPLALLTGIGAWFAAIPFAVLLFLIGGGTRSSFLAVLSTVVLCGAIAVLRSRPALFVEQLFLAGLLASALTLYFYIAQNGNHAFAALSLFAAFAASAVVVPQSWLRMLLGAGMGITGIVAVYHFYPFIPAYEGGKFWAILEVSILWCLLSSVTSRQGMSTHIRATIEAISLGMSAAIICSPFWVNDSFFFFELDGCLNRWGHDLPKITPAQAAVLVAVTITAAVLMAWKWAPLRALWFAVIALVLSTFAWCIPSLCVLALIGAVAVITGRKSTAVLCGGMLAWWIGTFYFSLQWPLVQKAMLLAASGCTLALTAAFLCPAVPITPPAPAAPPVPRTRAHAIAFLSCAVLTLGIANVSIVQKEAVAQTGTTLFVELVPVDPRSLMQGDYMRLAFKINMPQGSESPTLALVGSMNERGVWTVERPDNGTPLSAGKSRSICQAHPITRFL